METINNIFKLSAGVGLFLFAMYLLEESLKNLSGRNFKIFLQRATKSSLGAVLGGATVTAILQSSSMVSLMVLAYVGAGVFTMKNALGIILGANLGTTFSGWLIATLGFKIDIETLAYPGICIAGLLLILFNRRKTFKYSAYFLFGFGLLFIGLNFMKTSMEAQVSVFDFSKYSEMPLAVFLLIGFLITLLVQSSSVTMALTLTALHVGAINFPSAAAIVLGAETGTTIKLVLGSIGGSPTKKRVAIGNLLFNVFLTVFAFILLKPILLLVTDVFNINDPLIGLVTFSTFINILSIVIFLPLLKPFASFLGKFYKDDSDSAAAFIKHGDVEEPETALDLFRKETEYFIHNCMIFNLIQLDIDTGLLQQNLNFKSINEKKLFFKMAMEEKYDFLKQLQGELQAFYLELRPKLQEKENPKINQYISSVRSSMYSVKSVKDVGRNISNLRNSSKDIKFEFFISHKHETENLYKKLNNLISESKMESLEKLQVILNEIQNNYSSALNTFYIKAQSTPVENLDITTVINFNRELFSSNKAMFISVIDFLLEEKEAVKFSINPNM